ncbi:DUF91 domain-containing protein [Candidatus Parcubacteria bacterium]|nr:MAG: DUF91 domain-containing protein [Candidatus Parcubacteria bacterium]
MPDWRRIFGDKSEAKAVKFLRAAGYKILIRNYRTVFGEVDIVAKDGDEFVFVEVKARHSDKFGYPEEAVTERKKKK